MLNFDFLEKSLEIVFPHNFFVRFFKKNNFHVVLLTDQISLPNYLYFWNIGQYVYCNCLLTRPRRHKFWINLAFLKKQFFYMTKKSDQKLKYLENEKSF